MSVLPLLDPELAAPTCVDPATSQRLARAVRAPDGCCYHNALCALPRFPNATYVEGVVVVRSGLQFDHAWLERDAGVVDPTTSYIEMPDGDCTYFAGRRWTLPEVLGLFTPDAPDNPTPLLQTGTAPSARREAWIAAKLAAFRHVSALHEHRTGDPAIRAEEHDAMLKGLLGSYGARWHLDTLRATSAITDSRPSQGDGRDVVTMRLSTAPRAASEFSGVACPHRRPQTTDSTRT
ncbi:MAG: hypothetical protein V4813_13070 [Gemmatimonadota bacterium]